MWGIPWSRRKHHLFFKGNSQQQRSAVEICLPTWGKKSSNKPLKIRCFKISGVNEIWAPKPNQKKTQHNVQGHEKTLGYFPLNLGCLIRIRMCVGHHPLHTLNNQGPLFSLLMSCFSFGENYLWPRGILVGKLWFTTRFSISFMHPFSHPCMVYLPTCTTFFTIKTQPNVAR